MIERTGRVLLENRSLVLEMENGQRLRLAGKRAFELDHGDEVRLTGNLLPGGQFEVLSYKSRFLG